MTPKTVIFLIFKQYKNTIIPYFRNKIVTPKTAQITVRLQNIMMQLRKCCNHPYLLEYPLTADEEYRIDEDLVTSCGKMVLLDRMLKELKRKGHKVCVTILIRPKKKIYVCVRFHGLQN